MDLLIDHGVNLSPLEIKSGQTINQDFFKGLDFWRKLAGETTGQAWLAGRDVLRDSDLPASSILDTNILVSSTASQRKLHEVAQNVVKWPM